MRYFNKGKDNERLEPEIQHEDLNFVSDANAAILANTPKGGRLILYAAVSFFILMLTWAGIAEIDEVTKGEGKVIPSSQVQVIQNLEGGIVKEILVREGQTVNKNQVLLRIDDTTAIGNKKSDRIKQLALIAKIGRLKAEAEGKKTFSSPQDVLKENPSLARQELELFKSRQTELKASTDILKQQVEQKKQEITELRAKEKQLSLRRNLARKRYNLNKPLVAEGAVSTVELIKLEQEIAQLQGELDATKLSIPRALSSLKETREKVKEANLKFQNQARAELNEASAELQQLKEAAAGIIDRVKRTKVRSPVRGTVKQLLVNTLGGVVQPGANLVEIVPLEDTLLIEAKIRPQDIAFLRPEQEATIKFTAYDFAIYGGLTAKVEHISADTIADDKGNNFYQVRLRTEKNHLESGAKKLPIIPGMVSEVDVLTGKKTILNYLLKPILRAKNRALSER